LEIYYLSDESSNHIINDFLEKNFITSKKNWCFFNKST